MTPPFLPAAYEFVRCASGCNSWAPHHFRLAGDLCRLCSSCVLLTSPEAYCSECLFLLSPSAYAGATHEAHLDISPGTTARCSICGIFVAHLSCIADPYSFVCQSCAAGRENRPFSYDLAGKTLDGRSARILLTAALLAHDSALREAAAAREKAERSVQEAAAARRQACAMLDAACRAADVEAEARRYAEEPVTTPSAPAPAPAVDQLNEKTPQSNGSKKKTPKIKETNRDMDKLLKFDDMQKPALAFATAAAAAAAAGSRSLLVPSSRLGQNHVKQEAGGE
jgi:hypothetical protein